MRHYAVLTDKTDVLITTFDDREAFEEHQKTLVDAMSKYPTKYEMLAFGNDLAIVLNGNKLKFGDTM